MLCQTITNDCRIHSSPRRLAGEKKSTSYNHNTTIWVSHEYYLNPEFHKILSGAFRVIAILRFFPYVTKVDFKGLISKNKVLEIGFDHKIAKLNFVSHSKISQKNCMKIFL